MIRCSAGPRGAFAEGSVAVVDDEHAAQLVAAGAAVVLEQVVERAVAQQPVEHATSAPVEQPPAPPAAETATEQPAVVVAGVEVAARVRPPRRR